MFNIEHKWGLGIWKVEIDVENVNDVWRRLTEDTKQMRYFRSGYEQSVWSIGHVVSSSLSDLKYSLTLCRFLNRDFCMMLMDKCFHVMEFSVLFHYYVFRVHLLPLQRWHLGIVGIQKRGRCRFNPAWGHLF